MSNLDDVVSFMRAVKRRKQTIFVVKMASECEVCEDCGEPYCYTCDEHYADCCCVGPHQDDLYDYFEKDGILYAKRKEVKEDGYVC